MHSLTALLLATVLALAFAPAPQAQRKSPPQREKTECGTIIPPNQLEAELANTAALAGKGAAAQQAVPSADTPYHLPLTIHMVHDSNGVQTGLMAEQLDALMKNLNGMWRPAGVQFFIRGEIDHIFDDNFFFATTQQKRDALRKVNAVPNTINVYLTNLGLCGQASFTKADAQGVLLSYDCVDGSGIDIFGLEVFAHEMGHYFDLFHTHETDFGVECPSGNNCSTAGDRLCDTPADPNLNGPGFVDPATCAYVESAPLPANCDNTPYHPLTDNLMSLSKGWCRNQFTSGQISKILTTLRNASNRKNLINSGARYVDRLASASNTQCTYDAPCRTVAAAMQAANNGDALFLKWGTYSTSSVGGKRVTLNRWGFENGVVLWP